MESVNNTPLVTVLMPCYNAMPYLPEAIESILNQTYKNLEIICINDGSTDETPLVLDQYAVKDQRIRVVHNETNLKLIGTLNKGIQLAKGEYIARMDADDVSYTNRIEILFKELAINDVDVVSCNYDFIDLKGIKTGNNFIKCVSIKEIEFASYFFTPIGHALILGKRDVFIKNPYSLKDFSLHSEDYELWTRLIRLNYRLINVSKVLYSIRINPESVSRKYEVIQNENFVSIAQNHIELFLERKIERKIIKVVVNRMEQFSISDLKKGFSLMEEIHNKFSTQSKGVRFNNIVAFQKADILLQVIRKARFNCKTWAILKLFGLLLYTTKSKKLWLYLRSK